MRDKAGPPVHGCDPARWVCPDEQRTAHPDLSGNLPRLSFRWKKAACGPRKPPWYALRHNRLRTTARHPNGPARMIPVTPASDFRHPSHVQPDTGGQTLGSDIAHATRLQVS